jgi:hypothetical protein
MVRTAKEKIRREGMKGRLKGNVGREGTKERLKGKVGREGGKKTVGQSPPLGVLI